MPSIVRPARSPDLDAIQKIENDADELLITELAPDEWTPAPAGAARASGPGSILVAELDDGRIVGFVHVVEVEEACHLEQLSVTPHHALKGVGRTLVKAAKCEAAVRGHGQISLRTFADISSNAPFYATVGFMKEEPTTHFHRSLIRGEAEHGLDRYGPRVLMVALLGSRSPSEDHPGSGKDRSN